MVKDGKNADVAIDHYHRYKVPPNVIYNFRLIDTNCNCTSNNFSP